MNRVEWELYGQTNVDEVTDKTKKGLDGIEKNAKRVGDAFSMSVSSIFLRFLGPMALLQAAISWISTAIDESKQQAKEAMDLAVKGESMAVSAETAYQAQKYAAEDTAKKEKELADIATQQTTERYLRENGIRTLNKMGAMGWLQYGISSYGYASKQEDVQKAVQELIAEDMKKPGQGLTSVKPTDFKGPEGFSNVIGVGANPVLEAMVLQTDLQRQTNEILQTIAEPAWPTKLDFTKYQQTSPWTSELK